MTFKLFDEDFTKVRRYTAERDYRKAIDYLTGVSPKYKHVNDSKRSAYHYYLALYHSKIGDYKTADDHFNVAIADMSGRHQIAIEMATSYLQRGSLKAANEILEELENKRGIKETSLCRLFCMIKSRYLILSGNYEAAFEYGRQADRLDRHTDAPPIKETDLAKDYLRRKSPPLEGAFKYAVSLLSIDKKSNSVFKLSYTFLENFMKPLERPEDKVECLIALSRLAEELDDLKRSKIYIDRAIALCPNDVELRAERIRLACQSAQPEDALKYYNEDKEAIKKHPIAAIEVLEAFNEARQILGLGSLTQSFAAIATSLARQVSKQRNLDADLRVPHRA